MAYFRQRGDRWSFTIDVGRDPITAKRRQKIVSKDESGRPFYEEREARNYAEKMEKEIERGRKFESITLKDLSEQYFERVVKRSVAESTYYNQLGWMNRYIIPHLGHMKVDKITDTHIDSFNDILIDQETSKGLMRNINMVLNKIMKHAQKKRLIMDNPMKLVTKPSYKAPKMKVWSQEDVARFLEITKDSKMHHFYVLALSTGARRGELLALTWDDVSFDRKTITITKSLIYTEGSKRHVSGTKTENSRRTIRVPDYTLEALKKYKAQQMKGVNIVVDNLGEYWYPGDVSRYFKLESKRAGMPEIRLHDLRHTHATLLFQQGFNAKVVAERLGDTVEMVMKTYAHVLPNMQDEVASALDKLF